MNSDYVCPCDGYVRVNHSSDNDLFVALVVNSLWVARTTNPYDTRCLYVRKDMVVSITGSDINASARFIPLT